MTDHEMAFLATVYSANKTQLPGSLAARCDTLVKLKQTLTRSFIKAPKSRRIIVISHHCCF